MNRQLWRHFPSACLLLFGLHYSILADPISGTTALIISLAVSAAFGAASYLSSVVFAPKPKPIDKNKLQGDIQLTTVGEDIPITEIYGSSLGDGYGGIRVGGIIFYASPIRQTVTTTPGQSTGGGKGGPKPPPTNEHHYFVDLAVMVGRGPLRIRQIKANDDLLYQSFTPTNFLIGTTYEAESPTSHSSGWSSGADSDFSGLQKGTLPTNDWLQWNNIVATDDTAPVELYIVYKSSADISVEVTVNGGTAQPITLPDSFGLVANVNLPQTLTIGSSNTVRITNRDTTSAVLDRIVVGFSTILGGEDPCYLSGVPDPNYVNPELTYDPITLRDPLLIDDRGCRQYNYQPNPNSRGEVVASDGLRMYPGNKTQLPDPMLQAHFEAVYGAGATPAFRNRCYVVFENFEITRYRTIPNFTFVAEHETANSVGEMFALRAQRAGLDTSEFDFSALEAVPLRGYAIVNKQSPSKEMELFSRVYDIDVYEDFTGIITGVVPSETLTATIPVNELGSLEKASDTGESAPFVPVSMTVRDETDLPYFLDVSYFDPQESFETGNVHSLRDAALTDRKESIETGIVFTEDEAQKFADRELHKLYVEKDGVTAKLFHKHSWLAPTDLINVEDVDGSTTNVRIKAIEGWIPGTFEMKGMARNAFEYPPRLFVTATTPVVASASPPAPVIGTFMDMALFSEQASPGFYAAAALTDQHYSWRGAGLYRKLLEGTDDWEALDGIPLQAIMGRTIAGAGGVLADVPGGWTAGDWDATNDVTIDLYYGELETLTDDQVLNDKRNFIVIGDELIQFATATRVGGYPSRWTIERLQRKLSGTIATGHASTDRAVLYTSAWRYIEQNPSIAGTTRTYKFLSQGDDLSTASSVDWNWMGRTQFNTPVGSITDNGAPVVTVAPTVSIENGYWIIQIQRPSANGFTARTAEIHVRKASDDTIVRQWDIGDTVRDSILAQAFDCKALNIDGETITVAQDQTGGLHGRLT
jgi:hypothetical protein